jgi:methionine synthase II (cobalamin-independent)
MAHVHRNPPFRAEHLGSLLRPKELLQKRALFEKNELSQAEVTKAEDEAVDKVVKVQLDCGFHAVSDGEYRYDWETSASPPLFSDMLTPDALSFGERSLRSWKA